MVAVKRGLMGGVRALKEGSQLSHVTRLHLPVTGHEPPWPCGIFLSPCPLTLPIGGTLFRRASSTPHLKQAESISSTGTVRASCELDAAVRQCTPPEAGAPSQRLGSLSPLSGPCSSMPPCPAQRLCVTAQLDLTGKVSKDRSRLEETKEMLALPKENTSWKLLAG